MAKREEDVKRRKSYYGFAKNYPGKLGSTKYVIGDSKAVKRRDSVRRILIAVMIILLFIAKDAINGQSIGKKLMKIKVVDAHGKTPNIFKLIIRNITICIWPIEAILVLLNKKKLGDRLAGTNIVELTTTHNTREPHLCIDNF